MGRGADPLLEVEELDVAYSGTVRALSGLSLSVDPGEVVCVIGSNGAGKTTLVRALAGLLDLHGGRITGGTVRLRDVDVTAKPSTFMVRNGVCQMPEGRKLFAGLTVEENLRLGATIRRDDDVVPDLERIFAVFPRLRDRAKQRAGFLSGGEQQMVAIGRAIMARPQVLLCDELSLGLAPKITWELYETLLDLAGGWNMSLVVIEQNAQLALDFSSYCYLLETGTVVGHGPSDEMRAHMDLRKAYLGG